MPGDLPNHHQKGLSKAFRHAELTVQELWLRYFALGGDAGPTEVDAYLNGLMPLTDHDHNLLALAINERLNELPQPRAPYYPSPPRSAEPTSDPATQSRTFPDVP